MDTGYQPAEEDAVSARLKRRIVIAALVLGVAGLGGSALASSSSAGNTFFDDVARHLGVSPAKLQTAINQAEIDRLNQLVKQGQLTKAQAGAIEKQMKQHHGVPFGPFGGPFGTPFGGPHPFGNHHFRGQGPPMPFFFGSPMDPLQSAATYLGLSPQALGSDLRSGKTLAAIAKAKGKSVSGLEKAMLASAKKQLDSAVKAKRLTAAQESKVLEALSSRIDAFVTEGFHFGFGGPMHFSWGGHHRPDRHGSDGPSTAPTAFGL
jgi:AraC-like DNA-binding protein